MKTANSTAGKPTTRPRPKPTMLSRLLSEVAIYGGLPMRRSDIITLAAEHLGSRSGEPFGAQYFALHGAAVEIEPWPLDEAREVMSS